MPHCPACQSEIDVISRANGRCVTCGAALRNMPQRKVKDIRDTVLQKLSQSQSLELLPTELETHDPNQTIDTPANDTKPALDPDSVHTVELGENTPSDPTATVAFTGEQTVEFAGSAVDDADSAGAADSLVTAQWADNVAGGETDPEMTIKQKETVQTESPSGSSLVVKSRQFKTADTETPQIASLADSPDYELLEVIGEGGMGVVYSARQSSIARTVAIKMLKGDEKQTQSQRDKFISEAVVTGELDHPNIVPIYDLGSNDSGALFYSMKRVRGTPWDDVLQQRSLDENLNILLRVGDAIAFAHANGVLHRDLKPENVMLGDYGEVLVMDWGLARISPEFPNADAVSQSDVMGGTPAYMAPEMATGPVDQITTASDIYLLGAILFEILSGRPPHSGKTVMACLFAAAKNKLVETTQSGELFDIALRAMATDPADRYRDVQEFQAAIRQYLSHSESVLLTDNAAKNLEAAIHTDDYDLYSRSLYGFQEALNLWSGNERAADLLSAARGAYAQAAHDRGDFDLGISLLDAGDPQHAEVMGQLVAGRDERDSRNRRLKRMKRAVAVLLLAVAAIISVSYFAVRAQRNEAITQRDRADENFREAEAQRKVAAEQRDEAEAQRQEAQRQETIAKREEAEAKRQEQLAIQAKQAEAYEAYVARIGLANAKIEENAFDRAAELLEQCNPDLRQWEWGRLAYLCNLSHETWQVAGPVESVAISPDGRYFASGDWDGKAILWDLTTGKPRHTFSHGQYVHAVDFDATGQRLATGSSDRSVHIHDVASGELLQSLRGHTDAVQSVRFSADGEHLLTAGFDNTARLWNLATGALEQTLTGHSWWVWAAEFSPDGRRIVTASQDGKAIVWQRNAAGAYRPLTEFSQHRGPIYAARFSPDGQMIATAGHDRRVLLWNPDEVRPVDIERRLAGATYPPAPFLELGQHQGPVRALDFSPQGNALASGGQDNVLRIWNLTTNTEQKVLRGHASHVRDCAYSPDGLWLLSAGRDQQIKLWEPEAANETIVLGGSDGSAQADAVLAARFSRDGERIVTASRNRTATLWDVAAHEPLKTFAEGHDFLASSAVFFTDGARLATGAGDGTVRVWDVATGTEIFKLDGTGRTAALAVAASGKWLATGGPGNEVLVWNAQTGEQLDVLAGHDAVVTALGFAPDGRTLVSGDDLGRCREWKRSADSGEWTAGHELLGHSRSISAIGFTRSGRRVITASGDNTCGQWELKSGQELRELVLKHPDRVADMALSADGMQALTSCDDGVVRLWSLADARVLREIPAPDGVVFTSIDLSPDGNLALAACAANSTVQMWNLETGEEVTGENEGVWLALGDRAGVLWSARFTPRGDQVLTIGGNDAKLWDVETHQPAIRFSPHGAIAAADISPDGTLLVTGSWDRSAKIWDIATGKAIRKLDGLHTGYVNSVEFSPAGDFILTGSDDGTARLWETATGTAIEPVFGDGKSRIRQATFRSDGQRVLTAADDKTARLWDRQSGELLQTLAGHEWAVLCGEFSSDGNRVITGSEDNTARIWDADTGTQLLKLAGHTDSITSVAFSPDGRRAMTASQDNTAKLWDAETGKELLTLIGHGQELTSVSFSPDGKTILTSSRDGTTRLWPAVGWAMP